MNYGYWIHCGVVLCGRIEHESDPPTLDVEYACPIVDDELRELMSLELMFVMTGWLD